MPLKVVMHKGPEHGAANHMKQVMHIKPLAELCRDVLARFKVFFCSFRELKVKFIKAIAVNHISNCVVYAGFHLCTRLFNIFPRLPAPQIIKQGNENKPLSPCFALCSCFCLLPRFRKPSESLKTRTNHLIRSRDRVICQPTPATDNTA